MSKRSPEREEFLDDIISTAIEGGTGYWAAVISYQWDGCPTRAVIIESDNDADLPADATGAELVAEGLAHVIDRETIAKGIAKIHAGINLNATAARNIRVASKENDAGMIDADDADAIVQAALFGTLIYG